MRPLVFQKQISEAPASGPVPIGIPRDPDNLFLRPTGEGSFEIIVSGNIASGYLDKSLTAEKFVTDENGKTWWLSGDLVRLDESSGNYYFVGRLDDFVKVNDHNVSLVEVDSALNAQPGVLNSLTLTAEHKGRTRIVSFIETKPGSNLDQDQVIQFLRARIPSYSIPQLVLVLDAFPLTRSGKPDRAKLRNLAVLQFSRNSN
jgi:acyl-coenzyme A synthetase/AMP-(fatty) acid ligase